MDRAEAGGGLLGGGVVCGLWLVLRWARSLQAEAEGHHTGRNATYRAEDGDAAWRGKSQSSRGWEDRGTTVSPWGARGGWEIYFVRKETNKIT